MFSSLNPSPLRRGARPLAASLGFVILFLLLFAPGIQAQEGISVPGSRSPVTRKPGPDKELSMRDKAARGLAPLSRLYEHILVKPETTHRLPALPQGQREAGGGLEKSRRIGSVRVFEQPLDASADSSLYSVPDGEVRVMAAASEGALSLRVHFAGMALPPGARLFVYSMKNRDEIYGPYEGKGPNGDGTFWTPPVAGDTAVIELFTPGLLSRPDAAGSYFRITEVSHVFTNPLATESSVTTIEADAAGACNLNVTAPYANAAKAVGQLQFTLSDGEYICTGTLLNTQTNDHLPYLITANHCFSTPSAAQSLRVYWNYNTGDFPPPGTPFTDSSTLLSTGEASDYTFVRLTGSVPGGLWFNGWTTNVPAGGAAITGIHHPSGSHKRISFGTVSSDTICPPSLPGPCGNFILVNWQSGVTEGGSSGSELLVGPAADPLYVGNLWGGASSCSAPDDPDWYGGFAVTYPHISSYLAGTPVARTLTVASSNPASGVSVTVSPVDNGSQGSGTTQFTRTYNNNTVVNLTAPAAAAGNNFQKWQRNGVDWSTNRVTNLTMDANYTMTAIYTAPPSETTPPSLNITSHTNGQTVTTATIVLRGNASDSGLGNSGISSVTVDGVRAGGDTATGAGTSNWSRTISLNTGSNLITVIAKDGKQNSTTRSITVNRSTPAMFSIEGTVKVGTAGLSGVTLTLTGGAGFATRTFTTTTTGIYSFTNLPGGRNYIVKPSKLGYNFVPASRTFNNLSANQTAATASFTGALKNYRSSGVHAIPDAGTVDVPLVVADAGTITDLNVRLRLNHTSDSDLDIFLIAPDGTMVELTTDNGVANDNYGSGATSCASTPTVFDDAAAVSILTGSAPFAGSFRPEKPLSFFNGKSAKGTWKLRIIDDKAVDVGTLYCFELQFNRP
ncbi:MAG: proprotein convertase P-domain-containing protein [Pyrinomonadaceae bacterium]